MNGRLSHVRKGNALRLSKGAAALELALVLPLLLLLAAGAADFGRIAHAYIALSNATRTGAEYGSRHSFTTFTRPSWEEQITLSVQREAEGTPTLDTNQLAVEISTVTDGDELFRVAVVGRLPFRTTIAWPWLPQVVNLAHRVEMRQIR